MKCIMCLNEGIDKEADVIYSGYSFCLECAIKYNKKIMRVMK